MSVFAIGHYDTMELVCSLKPRLPLFKGSGGSLRIGLRGPKKDAIDPDDAALYVNAKEGARWPEAKMLLERIRADGQRLFQGEIEYGRIYFEMMMPGDARLSGPIRNAYSETFTRLHLCLRGNPGAALWSGPSMLVPAVGQVVSINMREWHGAVNQGDVARIHLVLDARRRQPQQKEESDDKNDLHED